MVRKIERKWKMENGKFPFGSMYGRRWLLDGEEL